MFISIITDCSSANEFGRQTTRFASLFAKEQPYIATIGIESSIDKSDFDTLQAGGNLIDILDASEGKPGIIIVNSANRQKNEQNKNNVTQEWPNGSPFGYFPYKDTLVIATIDGQTLSLAKKFGLFDTIHVVDIPEVLAYIKKTQPYAVSDELIGYITDSKFRSFDYVPRVAKWLWDKLPLPTQSLSKDAIPQSKGQIWNIDYFGEAKTTLLSSDYAFQEKDIVHTNIGDFTFYKALKDVPNDVKAIIIGSSGLENNRFLEIVIQGKSVVTELGISIGDEITILL